MEIFFFGSKRVGDNGWKSVSWGFGWEGFFWVRSDRSIDRVRLGLKNKNPFFKKQNKRELIDFIWMTQVFFIHVKVACGLCHDPSFLPLEFCVVVKETKGSPSCQQIACLLASRSLKLTGEGFFFFLFVMGQNSFDGFGNIVQIMLEDTFSEFVDFVSPLQSLSR